MIMLRNSSKQEKTLIGIDIGASSVKIALMESQGPNQQKLIFLGHQELPSGTVVEGSIRRASLVVRAIEDLLHGQRLRNNRVATALPYHCTVMRRVPLPRIPESELQDYLRWEIRRNLPSDPNCFRIDYTLLPANESGDPPELLLAAAHRKKIAEFVRVINLAGLRPAVVEIDVSTLHNLYLHNYGSDNTAVEGLLHIGACTTDLVLLRGPSLLFATSLSAGAIRCYENLNPELDKAFSRFRDTQNFPSPERLFLSGGGSLTPGLPMKLSDRFSLPVPFLDPLKTLDPQHLSLLPGEVDHCRARSTLAIGLALRMARES